MEDDISTFINEINDVMCGIRNKGECPYAMTVNERIWMMLKRECRDLIDPSDPQPRTFMGMPVEVTNNPYHNWTIRHRRES